MDSEKTSLIILGVLALAFAIGIADRLSGPMPQVSGGSTGDTIAGLIWGGALVAMFAVGFMHRGEDRASMVRSMMIWGGIILIAALVLTFATQPSLIPAGNTTL